MISSQAEDVCTSAWNRNELSVIHGSSELTTTQVQFHSGLTSGTKSSEQQENVGIQPSPIGDIGQMSRYPDNMTSYILDVAPRLPELHDVRNSPEEDEIPQEPSLGLVSPSSVHIPHRLNVEESFGSSHRISETGSGLSYWCFTRSRRSKIIIVTLIFVFYAFAWCMLMKYFQNQALRAYIGVFILLMLLAVIVLSFLIFIMYTRTPPRVIIRLRQETPKRDDQIVHRALGKCMETSITPEDSCTVCLASFVPDDDILALPCNEMHCFHKHCITQWFETINEKSDDLMCPLCKAPV